MNSNSEDKEVEDQKSAKKICRYGKPVFTKSWVSGQPGDDDGSDSVFEWRGRFATSIDDEVFGPYDSLRAVLQEHDYWFLTVTDTTESFECESLGAKAVAKMLFLEGQDADSRVVQFIPVPTGSPISEDAVTFTINGEAWTEEIGDGFTET